MGKIMKIKPKRISENHHREVSVASTYNSDEVEFGTETFAELLAFSEDNCEVLEPDVTEITESIESDDDVGIDDDVFAELLAFSEDNFDDDMVDGTGSPGLDERAYMDTDDEDEIIINESSFAEIIEAAQKDEGDASDESVVLNQQTFDKLNDIMQTLGKEENAGKNTRQVLSREENEPNYIRAKRMLKQYYIRGWPGEDILRIFDGRSYIPLSKEKLENMVYQEISYEEKLKSPSCAKFKTGTIEYIQDEIHSGDIGNCNSEYVFSPEQIESIRGKVVLRNGVYDIYKDCMEEFDPAQPFSYCLEATFLEDEEELPTPAFDKVISDACCGDEQSIEMIHFVFGSLLIPNKTKKFPVVGPASNSGKSILFGHLLEHIIPVKYISHKSISELGSKFGLGDAEGKILYSCLDVDTDTISSRAVGTIKRSTGEDWVNIQQKYGMAHDIYCQFKFLFGTNSNCFCPARYDAGWANRILAVPFIHETLESEMDYSLPDKLVQEKDYIVTKILRKMRKIISDDGYIYIPESELSIKLKNEWAMPKTLFPEFVSDIIEVTGEKEDNYSRKELYEMYCHYFRIKALSSTKLTKLTEGQFISNLLKRGNGLIFEGRVTQGNGKRFANAVHRICGLRMKLSFESDIFDNPDKKYIGDFQ